MTPTCLSCGGRGQIRGRPPWHAGYPRPGPPKREPDVMITCPTCSPWWWCSTHRRACQEATHHECDLRGPYASYIEAIHHKDGGDQ